MRLPNEALETDGSYAVVDSFKSYERNFDAFTHCKCGHPPCNGLSILTRTEFVAVLSGIDWSNVVAAGSSAMLPLLPHRKDVKITTDPAVEDPLETYYQ
jgi:hypothetical protein